MKYQIDCKRRDLSCNHSSGDLFTCEDNMLFSRVKISFFHAKAHQVFHWCLYNNELYFYTSKRVTRDLLSDLNFSDKEQRNFEKQMKQDEHAGVVKIQFFYCTNNCQKPFSTVQTTNCKVRFIKITLQPVG